MSEDDDCNSDLSLQCTIKITSDATDSYSITHNLSDDDYLDIPTPTGPANSTPVVIVITKLRAGPYTPVATEAPTITITIDGAQSGTGVTIKLPTTPLSATPLRSFCSDTQNSICVVEIKPTPNIVGSVAPNTALFTLTPPSTPTVQFHSTLPPNITLPNPSTPLCDTIFTVTPPTAPALDRTYATKTTAVDFSSLGACYIIFTKPSAATAFNFNPYINTPPTYPSNLNFPFATAQPDCALSTNLQCTIKITAIIDHSTPTYTISHNLSDGYIDVPSPVTISAATTNVVITKLRTGPYIPAAPAIKISLRTGAGPDPNVFEFGFPITPPIDPLSATPLSSCSDPQSFHCIVEIKPAPTIVGSVAANRQLFSFTPSATPSTNPIVFHSTLPSGLTLPTPSTPLCDAIFTVTPPTSTLGRSYATKTVLGSLSSCYIIFTKPLTAVSFTFSPYINSPSTSPPNLAALPMLAVKLSPGTDCAQPTNASCTLSITTPLSVVLTLNLPPTPQALAFYSNHLTSLQLSLGTSPTIVHILKTASFTATSIQLTAFFASENQPIQVPLAIQAGSPTLTSATPSSDMCRDPLIPYCVYTVTSSSTTMLIGITDFKLFTFQVPNTTTLLTALPPGLTLPGPTPTLCPSAYTVTSTAPTSSDTLHSFALHTADPTIAAKCLIILQKPPTVSNHEVTLTFESSLSGLQSPFQTSPFYFNLFETSPLATLAQFPSLQAHPCLLFSTNPQQLSPPQSCQMSSTLSSESQAQIRGKTLTGTLLPSPVTQQPIDDAYVTAINEAQCIDPTTSEVVYTITTTLNTPDAPTITITFQSGVSTKCDLALPFLEDALLPSMSAKLVWNGFTDAPFTIDFPPVQTRPPLSVLLHPAVAVAGTQTWTHLLDITIDASSWELWTEATIPTVVPKSSSRATYECKDADATTLLFIDMGYSATATNTVLRKATPTTPSPHLECSVTITIDNPILSEIQILFPDYGFPNPDPTQPSPSPFNPSVAQLSAGGLASSTDFTLRAHCTDTSLCPINLQFFTPISSFTLPGNHFELPQGTKFDCSDATGSVMGSMTVEFDAATSKFSTVFTLKQVQSGPGSTGSILTGFLNAYTYPSCTLVVPVPQDIVRPSQKVGYTTEPPSTAQVQKARLPAINREPLVTLLNDVSSVCHVGSPCTYSFRFNPKFLELYPALVFVPSFPGSWTTLSGGDYCYLKQSGSVVIQVIHNTVFSTDTDAICSFLVTPLKPTPQPVRELVDDPITTDIEISFKQPLSPAVLDSIITAHIPMPINDPLLYQAYKTPQVFTDRLVLPDRFNFATPLVATQPISVYPSGVDPLTGDPQHDPTMIQIDSCVGSQLCPVLYQFSMPNLIRAVRFPNHFKLSDPAATLECRTASNTLAGTVSVSQELDFLLLTSSDLAGFAAPCTVIFPISETRPALVVSHTYQFVGDANISAFSDAALSLPMEYPAYSPYSATVLNSYIQGQSAQNYLTIQLLGSRSSSAVPIQLRSMTITFAQIHALELQYQATTTPASPDLALFPTYAISQLECGIPPSSNSPIQSTCRASPLPTGILVTFELATTDTTPYIWLSWSMGQFGIPSTLPEVVSSISLTYEATNHFAYDFPTKSQIQLNHLAILAKLPSRAQILFPDLLELYTLNAAKIFSPIMLEKSSWSETEVAAADIPSQAPFFVATGQSELDLWIRLTDILKDSEVVFQLVHQPPAGPSLPLKMQLDTTSTTPATDLKPITASATCTHCVAYKILVDTLSAVHFKFYYTDEFTTTSQPTHRSFIRMAVKTRLDLRTDVLVIPPTFGFSQNLITVYNYPNSPTVILSNYRTAAPLYLGTSSSTLQATLMDSTMGLRLLPSSTPHSLNSTDFIQFFGLLSDLKYAYTFDCKGWSAAPEDTVGLLDATCTNDAPNNKFTCSSAIPIDTFPLKAPNFAFPHTHCDISTTITGNFRSRPEPAALVPFTWTFELDVHLPPVVPSKRLIFPRFAIVCESTTEASFAVGGNGLYSITLPEGFAIPNFTGKILQSSASVTVVNRPAAALSNLRIVDITVGSARLLDGVAVPLFVQIVCPDDGRDVSAVEWTYAFTPLASDQQSAATTNQVAIAPLGYFVSPRGDKYTDSNIYFTSTTSSRGIIDTVNKLQVLLVPYTSVKKSITLQLAPRVKHTPIFSLHSSTEILSYPTWSLDYDPDAREFTRTQTSKHVSATLSLSEIDNTLIQLTFSDDIEMYSPTVRFEYSGVDQQPQLFPLPTTDPPTAGAFLYVYMISPYDEYLTFSACQSTSCSQISLIPFTIEPPVGFTFDFRPQFAQSVDSYIAVNRALGVSDILMIEIPSTSPFTFTPSDILQDYDIYSVSVTARLILVIINREINVNTPLVFRSQLDPVNPRDVTLLNVQYPVDFNITLSAFPVTVGQFRIPLKPEVSSRILQRTLSVNSLFFDFSFPEGFHANSNVKLRMNLGRDIIFGQTFQIHGIPLLATISSPRLVTQEGFLLLLTALPDANKSFYGTLLVQSMNTATIPAGTLLTIVFPSSNAAPTNIASISLSSAGLGSPVLLIDLISVARNVPFDAAFTSTISPLGSPTIATTPSRATPERTPPKACIVDSMCWVRLEITTKEPQVDSSVHSNPITIPKEGLFIRVYFNSTGINLRAPQAPYAVKDLSSDQNLDTVSEQYSPPSSDGIDTSYTAHRSYFQNYIQFYLKPNAAADIPFDHLQIPLKFTKAHLDGVIIVNLYHVVTAPSGLTPLPTPFFTELTPGPIVWATPSQAPSTFNPIFFYAKGGLFVEETEAALGLIPDINLASADLVNDEAAFAAGFIAPVPRYLQATYDFDQALPTTSWPAIASASGLTTRSTITTPSNTTSAIGLSALYPSQASGTPAFALTLINQRAAAQVDPYTISLITSPVPASPFNQPFNFAAGNPTLTISAYSYISPSQIFNAAPASADNLIARSTSAVAFTVRRKPWMRITPLQDTVFLDTPTILTLSIVQQFYNPQSPNQQYQIVPGQSFHFTLPPFYSGSTIPSSTCMLDKESTKNSTVTLKWVDSNLVLDFPTTEANIPLVHFCNITVIASQTEFAKQRLILGKSPEITLSTISYSGATNLPTTDSTVILPPETLPVQDLYLQFFMPMPVPAPVYHIDFEDIEVVGVPGLLRLTLNNTFAELPHTILIQNTQLPFAPGLSPGQIGTECADNFGNVVSTVVHSDDRLFFEFRNTRALLNLSCSVMFTSLTALQHNGELIKIDATLSSNRPIVVTASFTSSFRPTAPLVIRPQNPTIQIQATLIKGMTSLVTLSGSEFSVPDEMLNSTSLSLSTGTYFMSPSSDPTNITGLTCVNGLNKPFADISFVFLGQVIGTAQPLRAPENISPLDQTRYASDLGLSGVAFRANLMFRSAIDIQSQWTCSFSITTAQDYSGRAPDAALRVGLVTRSITMIDRLIFKPVVEIDLGIGAADRPAQSMSQFTFYYNSTALDQADRRYPANVRLTLPQQLRSGPYDGVHCQVNNSPSTRLPLTSLSISSLNSFYSIPLDRYLSPTGTTLNRITCTIPNLSVRSFFNSEGRFQFGTDVISQPFSLNNAPSLELFEIDADFVEHLANDSNPLVLFAYSDTNVAIYINHFESIQPATVLTTDPFVTLSTSAFCISGEGNPFLNPALAILAQSIYGTITLVPHEHARCMSSLKISPSSYPTTGRPASADPLTCSPFALLWNDVSDFTARSSPSPSGALKPCVRDTKVFYTLPHSVYQSYPVQINYLPILRQSSNEFRAAHTSTPGFIDFEFSGYPDSHIAVWVTPTSSRGTLGKTPFKLQVSLLDDAQTLQAYATYNHEGPATIPTATDEYFATTADDCTVDSGASNTPFDPDQVQKVQGVLIVCSTASLHYDRLSTLRIAYNTWDVSDQQLSMTIWAVPGVFPTGEENEYPAAATYTAAALAATPSLLNDIPQQYHKLTYTTALMVDTPELPIIPSSSPSIFVSLAPQPLPDDGSTPPVPQTLRGSTQNYLLEMHNISPMYDLFPTISWLKWSVLDVNNAPDPVKSDEHAKSPIFSSVAYHLRSPHGLSTLQDPLATSLNADSAVRSQCFNLTFSNRYPLVDVLITSHEDTLYLSFQLSNKTAITSYLKTNSINSAALTCTFPLAFVAEDNVVYRPALSTWTPRTPVHYPLNLPTAPLYFKNLFVSGTAASPTYPNSVMVALDPPPSLDQGFESTIKQDINLSSTAVTIAAHGSIHFDIRGRNVYPGDVLIFKLAPDLTNAAASIPNPRNQPYRFSSLATPGLPVGFAECIRDSSGSTSNPSMGYLVAVSPQTFLPIPGGQSDTFALYVTQITDSFYPEFSCSAAFSTLSTLPYNGLIFSQVISQRQLTWALAQQAEAAAPISLDCTENTPEVLRFCPGVSGQLGAPITQGVDLAVISDDVIEPRTPVFVEFRLAVHPFAFNVTLVANFTQVRFSSFFGCDGFPQAKFYGELGSAANADILSITVPVINGDDIIIRCKFLSSRYIQPQYYLTYNELKDREEMDLNALTPETAIKKRTPLAIPLQVSVPDPSNPGQTMIIKSTTFPFLSTFVLPRPVVSLRLMLIRSKHLSYIGGPFARDPYLDELEREELLQWLYETMSVSLFKLTPATTNVLLVNFAEGSLEILDQQLDTLSNNLSVPVAFHGVDLLTKSIYVSPFPLVVSWLREGDAKGINVSFLTFSKGFESATVYMDRYIEMSPYLNVTGYFDSCESGTCGGSCEPCPIDYPCDNHLDCRYGLYCYRQIDNSTTVAATPGDYSTIIIKQGLTGTTGTCKPLGFGLADGEQAVSMQVVEYLNAASPLTTPIPLIFVLTLFYLSILLASFTE